MKKIIKAIKSLKNHIITEFYTQKHCYRHNIKRIRTRQNIIQKAPEKKSFALRVTTTGDAAFTLAEVLITLGIIGVVAALTIPVLFSKIQEQVLVHRLKDTYAILNEAYKLAIVDHDSPESWDIGLADTKSGALKLHNYLKPYLKNAKDCGTSTGCFGEHYTSLFGKDWAFQPNTHTFYARAILANGVSLAFWSNGSGCGDSDCGAVIVDLNADAPPNRAGVDYFVFILKIGEIAPADSILVSGRYGNTCNFNNKTSTKNGAHCTAWVIAKGNMDYLRRDIKNDWKKYKGIE